MDMNNMQTNNQGGCMCHKCAPNCNNACQSKGGCDALKKQLMCVCFALDEVILYLDAYPYNTDALCHYHTLLAERNKLLAEYEATCGPISAYGNTSHDSWDWIKSPWPWTYEANL